MNAVVRSLAVAAVGAALWIGSATSTHAQESDGPCTADVERLCEDAGPSKAERTKCLRTRIDDVSEGCRALLGDAQQRRADAGEACGADAAQFCTGAQPGRHNTGMLNCLRDNAGQLSDACRSALDALPGKKRDGAASGI